MRDDRTSSASVIGRRTVLATAGGLLAGVGSYPSVLAGAREDPDRPDDRRWPVDGLDEQNGVDESDGQDLSDDSDENRRQTITDDTGTVQITVPAAWDDINSTQVGYNPSIIAAPDLDGYLDTRGVPGVEVAVTTRLGDDLDAILDRLVDYSDECDDGGQQQFRSDEFTFLSQIWRQCSGDDTMFLTVVGAPVDEQTNGASDDDRTENGDGSENGSSQAGSNGPTDAPYVLLIGAQIVTEADVEAISTAIESLEVRPSEGQLLRNE